MEEVCEPGWKMQSYEQDGRWITIYEYKLQEQYKQVFTTETYSE